MTNVAAMLQAYRKDLGEGVGSPGGAFSTIERCPTGVFEFDLATGGGFPRGKFIEVYGPESSAKSTLMVKAIAQNQVLRPEETNIVFDLEHVWDPDWVRKLGADPDRIIVMKPDYAEQAVDMVEGFLQADDCGIIGFDSIAAMVTNNEAESSSEKALVGGSALVVGKMTRKVIHRQRIGEKTGRSPTFIAVNQTRMKVGVMYGNPETRPGGNAPRFASSMTVRMHGKNVVDNKVSKVVPAVKEVSFALQKWKCPILATHGMFNLVTYPHKGLLAGQTDPWKSLNHWLQSEGRLVKAEKAGAGWLLDGAPYPKLDAIQEHMAADPEWAANLRGTLIHQLLEKGDLGEYGASAE